MKHCNITKFFEYKTCIKPIKWQWIIQECKDKFSNPIRNYMNLSRKYKCCTSTKKSDNNVADKDIFPSSNERKIQSLVMVFPYVFMYYV